MYVNDEIFLLLKTQIVFDMLDADTTHFLKFRFCIVYPPIFFSNLYVTFKNWVIFFPLHGRCIYISRMWGCQKQKNLRKCVHLDVQIFLSLKTQIVFNTLDANRVHTPQATYPTDYMRDAWIRRDKFLNMIPANPNFEL